MRRVMIIFINDLRRRLKSPLSVVLMMAIPLAMTLVIGGVFGRSGNVELPRITMLIRDAENGITGRFIKQAFAQGRLAEMFEIVEVDSLEGEELMADGKASAYLTIPPGFMMDLLDQKPVSLRLVKNPSESFKPIIAEEAVSTLAALLDGGASTFREPIKKARTVIEADKWPSLDDMQLLLDESKAVFAQTKGYVADSLMTLGSETAVGGEEAAGAGMSGGFNVFSYVMSGSLMLGLLFTSNIMLKDIVREKGTGTLARTLCAPLNAWHVVAGKVLSVYAVTAIACVLLLIVGKFAFRMDLGDPAAMAAHIAAAILMCTGLMAFIFGAIKSERAADTITPVVIIILCLLGGSMLSFDMFPETLQRIGKLSPVFWANDGFKSILLSGAGASEISRNIAVLAAFGFVTLIPGAILLGSGFRKGR